MGLPDIDLTNMGMNLNSDVNLGGGLSIAIAEMTNKIIGDSEKPIATLITGDPLKPVAATVDLLNFPHFTLQDIKDLKTGRIRIPHYNQMCFKIMGIDLFSLCLSGESQVISDHYEPNAYEKCEITCCPVDTRPFPGDIRPDHS